MVTPPAAAPTRRDGRRPGNDDPPLRARILAAALGLCLALACTPGAGDADVAGGPDSDATTDADRTDDGATPDRTDADARDDSRFDDAGAADDGATPCDPGCHWDCFGGTTCTADGVYVLAYAPRDCCHFGDPWPGDGPLCSSGGPHHICDSPSCRVPDERYGECLQRLGRGSLEPDDLAEALRLHCPEGGPKSPGDPCTTDADCRPVAEGAAPRLRCDTGLSACVADVRPPPPAGFGASCGATRGDVLSSEVDVLVTTPTCPLCHAIVDWRTGCVLQACTADCRFDEDCPDGTVCLCTLASGYYSARGYCAGATDRDTVEGRIAWLTCPDG
ncbi:MAG: hypothetical protein HY905_08755 [Deltaproteobacteria bacterium]|nr:hypothetical protein [Deltaproteobacteria bacterium]